MHSRKVYSVVNLIVCDSIRFKQPVISSDRTSKKIISPETKQFMSSFMIPESSRNAQERLEGEMYHSLRTQDSSDKKMRVDQQDMGIWRNCERDRPRTKVVSLTERHDTIPESRNQKMSQASHEEERVAPPCLKNATSLPKENHSCLTYTMTPYLLGLLCAVLFVFMIRTLISARRRSHHGNTLSA